MARACTWAPGMTAPKVSVVLTTYNQAPWLRRAIDSVLEQTMGDWELLLIDNGSTDGSDEICASYTDPRIRYRRYEKNEKHTVVSNAAFREAKGTYIAFLYGDDYYLPNKLAVQSRMLDSLPKRVGAVYCSTYVLEDSTGQLTLRPCAQTRGKLLEEWLRGVQGFMPVAPVARREAVLDSLYYEDLFMEGEAIFTKIAFGYEFDFVAEALDVMTSHANNMGKAIDKNLASCEILFNKWFDDPRFPRELLHLRGVTLGNMYALAGWEMIRRERRYRDGRRRLLQAARHNPRVLKRLRVLLGFTLSSAPRFGADRVIDVMNLLYGTPPGPAEG